MPQHATPYQILETYEQLKCQFKQDALSEDVTNTLEDLYLEADDFLDTFDKEELISDSLGKKYFSFRSNKGHKLSRAINSDLYLSDPSIVRQFLADIRARHISGQTAEEITRACYTIAISFCSCIDLMKSGDQKTPGTFFEYFMGHLFAVQFGMIPKKSIDVLNLDMKASLPTDFIFDLGKNRPKFHVPIKTSTRERVVQVWAHQRVLDGVYGNGRFLGLLSCLSETKLDHRKKIVTEICLPDQWRIYQLFISRLSRIYYLDMPIKYAQLSEVFPPIYVKPFGEFFSEADQLSL